MSRPAPNRLGMYADIKEVLDAALASDGGTYHLPTHGKAVHWRQRAYRFRKLFAETIPAGQPSPYDKLVLKKVPPNSATVRIVLREIEGTFQPNREAAAPLEDDLLSEALKLAEELGDE